MNRKSILAAGLATLVSVFAMTSTGCPNGTTGGTGLLQLLVTDKPFPFDHVASATVTITAIRVHRAGDDGSDNENENENGIENENDNGASNENDNGVENSNSDDEEDDDGDSPWVTIFEGEKTFDLLDLRNGRTDLLADVELAAGTYDQMRLVVTAGEVTLTDGRVFPLKVPSGEQSGIKQHFEFEVQDGQQSQLLLDIDLSRAFSAIPSGHIDDVSTITSFKFSPSLAMRLINIVEAGTVSGLVTDDASNPLEGVSVTVFPAESDEEVSTAVTEADGTYKVLGLTTGTYRVVFEKDGFTSVEVADVAVQAGQDTAGVNATLSAAP